jgi:hypothetical protein
MKRALSIALVVLGLPLLHAGAWAATIIVPTNQPTIQAAIDAAAAGDVIQVRPGLYDETATNRFVFGTNGPHQFGLFIDKDVTIQGVKADGSPVTTIADIAAIITTNSTANFGPSGIFVQADGVTLEGLQIGDNFVGGVVTSNKTVEIVGDGFVMNRCKVSTSSDEGAVYMGEWDASHPVASYSLTNNVFHNTLVSINNGVGVTGPVSGRVITGNLFSGVATPYLIGFRGWNGANPAQGWIVSPVGGAIVTGNNFTNTGVVSYVIARGNSGGYDNSQLDWSAIWSANTYGNAAVALSSTSPMDVRTYTDAAGYTQTRRIAPGIQSAIDVAADGDVIRIAGGTYVMQGQVLITKDLTFEGDPLSRPVIMTNQNTGNSGDSRGWWLVPAGNSLHLSNLVFDGSGYLIDRAIYSYSPGSMTNCELRHIGYNPSGPNYAGRGIVFWGAPWTITGNTLSDIGRIGIYGYGPGTAGSVIQGNTYLGKGAGDWLDYGIELEGGANATVSGNLITGCLGVASVDGSGSAGMLMTTYWAPGTGATVTGNTITGNSMGLYIGYAAGDGTTVVAHGNNFGDNAEYGVYSVSSVHTDATGNWWGSPTGPTHPSNPGGTGSAVDGDVDFGSYLTSIYNITQSLSTNWIALNTTGTPTTTQLTVACVPTGAAWRGVNVTLTYDSDALDLTNFEFLFTHTDSPLMYWTESSPGVIDASITIPGLTAGQLLSANLFRVTFDGIAAGDTPIHLATALVRNLSNQPISPVGLDTDEILTVDGSMPTMAIDTNPTGSLLECLNPTSLVYALSASDNVGLHEIQVQVTDVAGAHGWTSIASGISTPVRDTDWTGGWTFLPAGYVDGTITVSFRCIDGVNNTSTVVSDQFTLDRVAPVAPGTLDADPAFHACDLSWTGPGDQTGYTLYWKKRTGYPYATGLPTAWNGLGTGDGNVAILAAATSHPFVTDNSYAARGVYDFTLAATDCAGNTTRSAVFSATNYFLGDVTGASAYDGHIESLDLNVIAAVYGSIPTTDPGREMNVGPTHNYSSYGLPAYGVTNALVNFEDLIIFAMNYGPSGPQLPVDQSANAGTPELALTQTDETFTLTLDGQLKGFSARVECEAALLSATADFPVFFYRDGGAWIVDAVSFNGNLVDGSAITLDFAGQASPVLASVDGRDQNNQAVAVTANDLQSALPTRFALEQNYPNPFNPTTTIRYALPEAAQVSLVLYNALGQEVLTLNQGSRDAGFHELRLDGSPLASGVYVYRLEAGRFADQKKLVLVK